MLERLCLIGIGLIGGSIARAARAKDLAGWIVGSDLNPSNLHAAKRMGVVDEIVDDPGRAADGCGLIVIATPVGAFPSVLSALKPGWSAEAVYTDVGSTKRSVVDAVREVFGELPANFVPGHPIAGAENGGVEASLADLFEGRRVILTPLPSTRERAVRKVASFWRSMGSIVSEMEVEHHDAVLAATSHLPHVVAYALTDLLGRKDETEEIFQFAAGGFRDFTRIASSDPIMWRDICLANRAPIVALIEELTAELDSIAKLIQDGRGEPLMQRFNSARTARRRFLDRFRG